MQDAVEQLLIGRGLFKGEDYDREVGRVKMSVKELVPDFIFLKLNLALEVKLVNSEARVKQLVDEINADIAAYSKRYRNLFFLVYDTGYIRYVIRLRSPLRADHCFCYQRRFHSQSACGCHQECARSMPHKFKTQSARRNVISPLSSFHRLDRLVSFTSQVASALAFISRSVSA